MTALAIPRDEPQIPIRPWSFRSWRNSLCGSSSCGRVRLYRSSRWSFRYARGTSCGARERLGPSSIAVWHQVAPLRRWRGLLRIFIGPCLGLLGPASGGVPTPILGSCLVSPAVGYDFRAREGPSRLISGVGYLAVFVCLRPASSGVRSGFFRVTARTSAPRSRSGHAYYRSFLPS